MTLSICMIVKNEESCLGRCLESLKGLADEIIIVDTGSVDRTKEVAKRFTDKIFDFAWVNDFSKARNFSISKATKDWILVMDADEVIDEDNKRKILKANETESDAVLIIQREYRKDDSIMGFTYLAPAEKSKYTLDYEGYTSTPIIRLFRNSRKIYYSDAVHETIGNSLMRYNSKILERKDIFVHHYKDEKGMDNFRQRQINYFNIEQEVIKREPRNARAHYKIAGVYDLIFRDYDRCLEHLRLAYEYGYNERFCLIGIASCYLRLNNEKEAEKTFVAALSKGIAEPVIYYELYRIYFARKDFPRANIVLNELIKYESHYKDEAMLALKKINDNAR